MATHGRPAYSGRVPMTTRSRATALVAACTLVVLLAACRPTVDGAASGVTPNPGAASGVTPTPGAAAVASPDDTPPPPDAPRTTRAPVAAGPTAPGPAPEPAPPAQSGTPAPTPDPTARTVSLPAPGTPFEYQLGGAEEPDPTAGVVVRDSTAPPTGRYDVCYVNGFQTQPDETDRLVRSAPELVLHHGDEPLRDEGWPDEVLYDITSPDLRQRVAERVGRVIDACAAAGFDAVEVDNLDSYTRSLGRIAPADTLAYTALLVERAHAAGLAFAQKNTAELTTQVRALGADLAVAEECREWEECDLYTAVYPVVLAVEYDRAAFDSACAAQSDPATRAPGLSVVLRDVDVLPRVAAGAVHATC